MKAVQPLRIALALALTTAVASIPVRAGQAYDPAFLPFAIPQTTIAAGEARQGVASDGEAIYAIDNSAIGKYAISEGVRLAGFAGSRERFPHMNSCIVYDHELVCAASNYPATPHRGRIEVFATSDLAHRRTIELPDNPGSLTALDRRGDRWWAVFAHYDGKGGVPGKGHAHTTIALLDEDFLVERSWTLPAAVLTRLAPYSLSGAVWSRDGRIYAAGHDKPEIYVLELPQGGSVARHLGTFATVTFGQAIALDPRDPTLLWSIDRATRTAVASRIPSVGGQIMRLVHKRPRFCAAVCLGLITASAGATGGSASHGLAQPAPGVALEGDLTVLTYNVKDLPWPVAGDRSEAMRMIGYRLRAMREQGRQPTIVVLQEAFTDGSKAIGAIAGYRHHAIGPQPNDVREGDDDRIDRRWYLGETQGKSIDSGLVVLSDLPIDRVAKSAFRDADCAGYDCLAAKGAMLVEVDLPGTGAVAIATTHLNSRSASGAGPAAADAAFARQAEGLADFLRREWRPSMPLIFAGDFNRGAHPDRVSSLHSAIGHAAGSDRVISALDHCLDGSRCVFAGRAEARSIAERGIDIQFTFAGADRIGRPAGVAIPFPLKGGLSDHPGFSVAYRFERIAPLRVGRRPTG